MHSDKSCQLSCYLANVRSLNNKFSDLQSFININNPDIFVLTETWLDQTTPSSMFVDCNTFNVFRKDRPTRGGGVCLLIKNSINTFVSQVVVPSGFDDLDIVAIDLRDCNDTLPIRLIAVYRPPSMTSSDNARLFSVLDLLAEDCVRLCVFGDLNLPYFNWDLFVYPENFLYSSAVGFICNHGLTQLVSDPTRGDSILDLILCSDLLCCDNVEVLPPLANSDHSVVSCSLCITIPQSSSHAVNFAGYNYSKANWVDICTLLHSINWQSEFADCISTTQYWEKYLHIVNIAVAKYVPVYKGTGTAIFKHYPKAIRELASKKLSCWKLYSRFRTNALHIKYTMAAKKYSKAVTDYVSSQEFKLIESNNIGKFYKYVNGKLNGSNGIAALKDGLGHYVYTDKEKAELLNKYFGSIFTNDNGIIDASKLPSYTNSKLQRLFITPEMVFRNIKNLKASGGAGPDGLPSEFYKNTAILISYPLSVIFNISLQTGELPDIWRYVSITPVFKKGSPADPSNYRPISLTCIACKLIECCIKRVLMAHLLEHKIINKQQHGFLRKRSTVSQLLECSLDWNVAINAKQSVDVIYLDYAKAFDSVVHDKLLIKLQCCGIADQLLSWIKNFLLNRKQYVKIGACISTVCDVISGVPQGSVLGPVLFIIFVNDICSCVTGSVQLKLFADDSKIYTVLDDSHAPSCLQLCLDNILNWSQHWQLTLSPTKCTAFVFCPIRH